MLTIAGADLPINPSIHHAGPTLNNTPRPDVRGYVCLYILLTVFKISIGWTTVFQIEYSRTEQYIELRSSSTSTRNHRVNPRAVQSTAWSLQLSPLRWRHQRRNDLVQKQKRPGNGQRSSPPPCLRMFVA